MLTLKRCAKSKSNSPTKFAKLRTVCARPKLNVSARLRKQPGYEGKKWPVAGRRLKRVSDLSSRPSLRLRKKRDFSRRNKNKIWPNSSLFVNRLPLVPKNVSRKSGV